MKIVIDTNMVSPHTAPLAAELAKLCGDENVVYLVNEPPQEMFRTKCVYEYVNTILVDASKNRELAMKLIDDADLVIENRRDFDLIQRRVSKGKLTFYVSERWFKPIDIFHLFDSENVGGWSVWVSGILRLLFPFGRRRAKKILEIMQSPSFLYLPIGIHAMQDMARLCGIMHGDLRCWFSSPRLVYEKRPGSCIKLCEVKNDQNQNKLSKKYGVDKMRLWGYFVNNDSENLQQVCKTKINTSPMVRILWVGRLLGCKLVEDIVRAIVSDCKVDKTDSTRFCLDIYGHGPAEEKIRKLVKKLKLEDRVSFYPFVDLKEVRFLMRQHDVYVFSSNAFDGWGAVVNEALNEGMKVIGTYEAGASSTILPKTNLYHARDWRKLRQLLVGFIPRVDADSWTAKNAAMVIMKMIGELKNER